MEDKRYNGWTNYETWAVKLWIDNEQGSQEYWLDAAREEQDANKLSQRLKDEFEDAEADILETAKVSASIWADLLGAALSEVNWYEIAESLIEDVKETA